MICLTRRSLAGFFSELAKETTKPRAPRSINDCAARNTSCSSGALTTVPFLSVSSDKPNSISGSTSGVFSSLMVGANDSIPLETSKPIFAPFRSMMVLVPIVLEKRIISMSNRKSSVLTPKAFAPAEIHSKKQTVKSCGVVGTLTVLACVPLTTKPSVKVPPVSISIVYPIKTPSSGYLSNRLSNYGQALLLLLDPHMPYNTNSIISS